MSDSECVQFLQWALPQLRLRWEGFRRVRAHVCKRLARRLSALALPDLEAYRRLLEANPAEWQWLDNACRITISRFHRDRAVWEHLRSTVLPELGNAARQRADRELRCWSAGCASGEEAFTLALAWRLEAQGACPEVRISIVGTDADELVLERARQGRYAAGTLRELPEPWRRDGLEPEGEEYLVRQELREGVAFCRQDLRKEAPEGCFDLVMCRNLAFTYFDIPLQQRVLEVIGARCRPGAALVIGRHEQLPPESDRWQFWGTSPSTFRRSPSP